MSVESDDDDFFEDDISPREETTSPRSARNSPSKRRRRPSIPPDRVKEIKTLKDLIDASVEGPEFVVDVDLSEREVKEIPEAIRRLPNLSKLLLHGNAISVIPEKIKSNSLTELDLSNNEIHTVTEAIANLRRLRHLNLTGNPFDFGNLEHIGILS